MPAYEQHLQELITQLDSADADTLNKSPTFSGTEPTAWLFIIDKTTFLSPYIEQVALLDGLYHCFIHLSKQPKEYRSLKDPIVKLLDDSTALLEAKHGSFQRLLEDVDITATLESPSIMGKLTTRKERKLLKNLINHDNQLLEDLKQLQEDIKTCEPKAWATLCEQFITGTELLCELAIKEATDYHTLAQEHSVRDALESHEQRLKPH